MSLTRVSLPASAEEVLAAQESFQAEQRAAVIFIRGLLDRWHLFGALESLPIQALLARLNSLVLGQPTIPYNRRRMLHSPRRYSSRSGFPCVPR